MSTKLRWPILIILSAIIAGIFAWANSGSPLRPILLFLFMMFIPGLAFTRLFNFGSILTEIVLAVALSFGISTVLAEFMVFAHLWSPNAGLGILVVISVIGALLQIVKGKRSLPQEVS